GALVGAGIVTLAEGTGDYRLLWQAWALPNALTALILLPLLLIGIPRLRTWKRRATPGRLYEAGLLCAGLLSVSIVAFGEPDSGLSTLAVRLYAPLPFLLWAAGPFRDRRGRRVAPGGHRSDDRGCDLRDRAVRHPVAGRESPFAAALPDGDLGAPADPGRADRGTATAGDRAAAGAHCAGSCQPRHYRRGARPLALPPGET